MPGLLAKLISEDLWVERDIDGQVISYSKDEFRHFVESPYPEGLSTTIPTIERLCGDNQEIKDFLAAAKKGKWGGNRVKSVKQTDAKGNVSYQDGESPSWYDGGSTDYRLNRLREQSPEYHSKVMSGDMKLNAAYVAAGFAPKRVAVNMNNAQSAYNTLTNNMPDEVLSELIDLLNGDVS